MSMTPTREQLELAAKAAGIVIHHWIGNEPRVVISEPNAKYEQYKPWQPVTSKSDSRDLEVDCEIQPDWEGDIVFAYSRKHGLEATVQCTDYNNDKGLATCAAVFLCAVEIGWTAVR